MTEHINGNRIQFTGDTLWISICSNVRHDALAPEKSANPRFAFVYRLAYSPAAGNTVNGVSTKDIAWTPALTAFITAQTGGAKFASIYAQARKAVDARNAEYARMARASSRNIDRGPYEL